MGNLNMHTISLYQTFKQERALGLASRLEIHYTPNLETFNALLEPWYVDRNKKQRGVD